MNQLFPKMAMMIWKGKMSKDWFEDIKKLNEVLALNVREKPEIIPQSEVKFMYNLIHEEVVEELLPALEENKDLVKIADGIVDSIVVLLGAAVHYGIDVRPIWDEIQKTNLAKKGGEKRADGKILKPIGWTPPDIKSIIEEQMKGDNDEPK